MNTLIISTFTCHFEVFEKFVANFHEKEGNKYVKEYDLIKVNDAKSHLIPEITDLDGFGAATSSPEMKEWDKANGDEDTVYALELIE
tara:strand:- start:70 stop:330 length:261 start_codon:yes stop_codon:yes gene_type:complete